MQDLIHAIYLESELGVIHDLESAGTSLENPYVYDSAARDLKSMADSGLVRIVREQVQSGTAEQLIRNISFSRLR